MIVLEFEAGQNEKHKIRYEKDAWSGAEKIFVDGQLVKRRKIALTPNSFVETGEAEKTRVEFRYGIKEMLTLYPRVLVNGQPLALPETPQIPKWGWWFTGACGFLPFLTAGGAIPALIGAGGAFSCVGVLKKKNLSDDKKALFCLGITLATWIVFLLFVISVSSVTSGPAPASQP